VPSALAAGAAVEAVVASAGRVRALAVSSVMI
jgi:hypothetical protein